MSPVWVSKPVVSGIEEEAMLLSVFTFIFSLFFVVVAVSTHLLSFSPFLLSCVAVGETDSYFFVCAGLLSYNVKL